MIENRWVFRDDYRATIIHRDTELDHLSRQLEPALVGEEASDALIYGSSGIGKTASSVYLLRQLNRNRSIESATIECAGKTGYSVIYEALDRHRTTTAIQPNAPTRKLIRTLRKIVDEPTCSS